jgi:hypothetical protein
MRGAAAAVGILILSPRAGGLPRPSPGCREANKKKKHKQKSTKKKKKGGRGEQKTHSLQDGETYQTLKQLSVTVLKIGDKGYYYIRHFY